MTAEGSPLTARALLRSEIEVAANAVWSLFDAGLLPKDPAIVRRAANAAGLSWQDLRDASVRRDRVPERRLAPAPVPARNGSCPAPAKLEARVRHPARTWSAAGRQRAATRAFTEIRDALACSRCGEPIVGEPAVCHAVCP